MTRHTAIIKVLPKALLLALAIGACKTGKAPSLGSENSAVGNTERRSLSIPVTHRSGTHAQVRIAGQWQSLTDATAVQGVQEVRARGRGSVISIGETRIWMRSGARVALSQGRDAALQIEMKEGQARAESPQGGRMLEGNRSIELPASDVLLQQVGEHTSMVATQHHPQAALWALELDEAPEPRGVGTLEVLESSQSALELRKLNVSVTVEGGMATTEVEHIFYNADSELREGTFRFPAPDGVMVTGLAMEIDGRLMEGEFVEKIKARSIYEEIVDEMQDPALLEWQQGGWFKLRVFPIDGLSEKRVVIRYAAPLSPAINGYEYRYLATPPARSSVGTFSLSVDGMVVSQAKELTASKDVVIPFARSAVSNSVGAEKGEFQYRVLTVQPQMPKPTVDASSAREMIIALDSSRSAMEKRELSIDLLTLLLAELKPNDSFAVFAHDIEAREFHSGLMLASKENIDATLQFARDLQFDGASDLGAMLTHAGAIAATASRPQIVYLGDGTPSWGETRREKLVEIAGSKANAPVYAAVLGRGASLGLWEELCGREDGKVLRPHTHAEARRDAFFLAKAMEAPRLREVKIDAPEGVSVYPQLARTVFAGDSITILLRAPNDKMPEELMLRGKRGGQIIEQKIVVASSVSETGLAPQRWASHEIARLESEDGKKEEVVALSREFGVLSKHTSLLVLESEEAYKQHQIERKNAKKDQQLAQDAPRVSGQDLDNLGTREARLSPDHIQPGDPEVRVPAPADARSVVLVFPFGDTKLAYYDAESQTWIARFLIDSETPDGRYWVRVTVEHANGEIEEMRLPYTVDTSPPSVSLSVVKLRGNRFRVFVNQRGEGETPENAQSLDSSRVEVQLPWGHTQRLLRKNMGRFARSFDSPVPLGDTLVLRVVVTDEALNQRVLETSVPVEQR